MNGRISLREHRVMALAAQLARLEFRFRGAPYKSQVVINPALEIAEMLRLDFPREPFLPDWIRMANIGMYSYHDFGARYVKRRISQAFTADQTSFQHLVRAHFAKHRMRKSK